MSKVLEWALTLKLCLLVSWPTDYYVANFINVPSGLGFLSRRSETLVSASKEIDGLVLTWRWRDVDVTAIVQVLVLCCDILLLLIKAELQRQDNVELSLFPHLEILQNLKSWRSLWEFWRLLHEVAEFLHILGTFVFSHVGLAPVSDEEEGFGVDTDL